VRPFVHRKDLLFIVVPLVVLPFTNDTVDTLDTVDVVVAMLMMALLGIIPCSPFHVNINMFELC